MLVSLTAKNNWFNCAFSCYQNGSRNLLLDNMGFACKAFYKIKQLWQIIGRFVNAKHLPFSLKMGVVGRITRSGNP